MILLNECASIPLAEIDKVVLKQFKKDLTINNPEVVKRVQLGLSLMKIAPTLKLYDVEQNVLSIPIGYAETALRLLQDIQIADKRTGGKSVKIEFSGQLRKYQQEALDALDAPSIGVISAPTGSGKSVLMCALIAKKAVTTLVLVNTIELANQFKDNLLKFTDLQDDDVSIIASGIKFKLKPVTIALLQSMHKMDPRLLEIINDNMGMVLTDEVHIVGADTYFSTLNKLKCKHKYGFSATPERDDGLTPLIFMASGPIRKEIKISDLGDAVMKPEVLAIKTEYHFPLFDMNEYQAMVTDLCNDEERNQLIVDTVELEKYKPKQKVLLCARVMQCIRLQEQIPGSKILVGNISKEDQETVKELFPDRAEEILKQKGKKYRRQVVQELNDGSLTTVISTFRLFSTGLDFSGLEIAAFCAPMKSRVLVKQCRGRIMRVSAGKQPLCIDFEDERVGLLRNQSKIRQRILKKFD
jgi:superfamily II DNA or RNA helicase